MFRVFMKEDDSHQVYSRCLVEVDSSSVLSLCFLRVFKLYFVAFHVSVDCTVLIYFNATLLDILLHLFVAYSFPCFLYSILSLLCTHLLPPPPPHTHSQTRYTHKHILSLASSLSRIFAQLLKHKFATLTAYSQNNAQIFFAF